MRFLSSPLLWGTLLAGACIAAAAPAASPAPPVILIVGDSISAGYGLPADASWPTLLQRRLKADNYPHQVVNASISGDTTSGGRSRLPALLAQHKPATVVIVDTDAKGQLHVDEDWAKAVGAPY